MTMFYWDGWIWFFPRFCKPVCIGKDPNMTAFSLNESVRTDDLQLLLLVLCSKSSNWSFHWYLQKAPKDALSYCLVKNLQRTLLGWCAMPMQHTITNPKSTEARVLTWMWEGKCFLFNPTWQESRIVWLDSPWWPHCAWWNLDAFLMPFPKWKARTPKSDPSGAYFRLSAREPREPSSAASWEKRPWATPCGHTT